MKKRQFEPYNKYVEFLKENDIINIQGEINIKI